MQKVATEKRRESTLRPAPHASASAISHDSKEVYLVRVRVRVRARARVNGSGIGDSGGGKLRHQRQWLGGEWPGLLPHGMPPRAA